MKLTLPIRENLKLRTLEVSDVQAFFDITQDDNAHLREWLGWLDDDKTVADTEKYIIESNKRFADGEGLDVGIFNEDRQVGGIGLFPLDTANKKASVAYWLTEDAQGKGIMSDTMKVLIEYVFTEMKLNRIEISCAIGNTKSSALPKKLGFTCEGVAREAGWLYNHFVDLEVYSLLASEWKK
jgi:ribosomal-protein-serine acetyltransferase